MWMPVAMWFLVAGALLGGCPDTTASGDGDGGAVVIVPTDAGVGDGCADNNDCPFGQVCTDGGCVSTTPPTDDGCLGDDDCEPGFACATSTGLCVVAPATPPPFVGPPGPCSIGDTRSCGLKVGRCDYGVERCDTGEWSGVCEGGIEPRPEACDGLDDDCDGETDEDFVVGDVCDEGRGVCTVRGRTICTADGLSTRCDAVALSDVGRVELCGNDDDDDCDGLVDEGFEAATSSCSAGLGVCARPGALLCSADLLTLECSATPGAAGAVDLCGNGLDDNCNGPVDEGFPTLGDDCTVGTAACATPGILQCAANGLGLTCVPTSSGNERCNGADDDDDGCIDEDFDVGVDCTVGLGICRASATKVCSAIGAGTICPATPLAPSPFGELCGNGLDDDCDGFADEASAFPTLGQACTVGVGSCARTGTLVCSADGRGVVCNAVAGAPSQELCGDGRDNDCNGTPDDGFDVGDSCTNGLGICTRSGQKICSADRLGTVCNAIVGSPGINGELCGNRLDDDCDGSTDEGFVLNAACDVGVGACFSSGTTVCSTDLRSTACNAPVIAAVPERCNDIDDDCNGQTDNGCDDDGDGFCDANLVYVGAPAICPLSSAMRLDCEDANATINPDAVEVCGDARDQNCDGNPNDGCAACSTAIDADFDGSNQCLDCDDTNGAIRPGATERCDGVDNNCDGAIDEGFDADGDTFTTCGTLAGGGGVDRARIDCNDNNRNVFPGACELCALGSPSNTVTCGAANDRGNGIDENCNGFIDEACFPCNPVDADGDGASECQGDCAPADPTVRPGLAEVCDGKDTDCNRTTVDNCEVGEPCNFPTAQTDECADRLICVQSLSAGGRPSGTFTCTSLCNQTATGAGLGDGCQTGQTCGASLTPTANLHGCALTTGTGAVLPGATCSRDDDCRSGLCFRDSRLTGNVKYCTDFCGNDDACGSGTTCQHWGGTAQCMRELTSQNVNYLGSCTSGTATRCKDGPTMCVDVLGGNCATGDVCRCSDICCTNSDCATGSSCSLDGTFTAGPNGGVDTVPACAPIPAANRGRQGGAACSANNDCESNFCDRHLGVCMDVCCHDATCPSGLTCESVITNLNPDPDTTDCSAASVGDTDDRCTFARMCVGVTPAQAVEKR